MYTNGFLPAVYQPTMFRPGNKPVLNLDLPKGVSLDAAAQDDRPDPRAERGQHAAAKIRNSRRASRPTIPRSRCRPKRRKFSISARSRKETLDLYGVGEPHDRRLRPPLPAGAALVEKGVRFVCVVSGGGGGDTEWDAHDDIEENHITHGVPDRSSRWRR